jgi:hypothetical protein
MLSLASFGVARRRVQGHEIRVNSPLKSGCSYMTFFCILLFLCTLVIWNLSQLRDVLRLDGFPL